MIEISEEVKNLAIMAHDLKAPLSVVVNLLSIIEKGYVEDAEKVKDLISRARRKSEILVRMVEDILDYTLLENKSQMKRERLDIFAILKESVSITAPFASEEKVSLIHHIDEEISGKYVYGNFTFLFRAFNNVIMNAIKYNKEGGKIDIYCSELDSKENMINVEIIDTGIGMSEEELKEAFTLFRRGKSSRKNIDGSIGLGLALVKQIIQDHEGTIDIASTPNVGTTVSINLPLFR